MQPNVEFLIGTRVSRWNPVDHAGQPAEIGEWLSARGALEIKGKGSLKGIFFIILFYNSETFAKLYQALEANCQVGVVVTLNYVG